MGSHGDGVVVFFFVLFTQCALFGSFASEEVQNQTASLTVDAAGAHMPIPETLFGIFFEEINHAGAGGLWAELVSNRGFEAGGPNTPSNIDPWSIIGDESLVIVSTERSSCFSRNEVALRMEVLCDSEGSNICPAGGVGIYNPGYWGMNIEQGKTYRVVLHVRSQESMSLSVSLTSPDGLKVLATTNILAGISDVWNWTRKEILLEATGTDYNSRLTLTTTRKGVIWLDQVSAFPVDTYKGHGFRKDLVDMLAGLKPRFMRFPGGSYVEGEWLRNAFRWRVTIGPWEERPGHFGDVWGYWTDDGLGYFELLQLAEDLGALPIWVVNIGISFNDEVASSDILPFVQDILDSIEFARGDSNSTWGSVRAAMGHTEPFQLSYIALGNEDCGRKNYQGNYVKFYNAIKASYPDIKIISNCDGSSRPLDHAADLFDFHIYTSAGNMFSMAHQFDHTPRGGPKVFVSEYAVTGKDAGNGSLLAALAEAGFLIGLEKNSDIVAMASYAPLFVNSNDRRWNPDAIVFNSWQHYGTPSYWAQHFFKESSGAVLLPVRIEGNSSSLIASAIIWQSLEDGSSHLKIKIVNFGSDTMNLAISVTGLDSDRISSFGSTVTELASYNLMAENSFNDPVKVSPNQTMLKSPGTNMNAVLSPQSFTAFDMLLLPPLKLI